MLLDTHLAAQRLSRWTKVLSQIAEPKVGRKESRFATGFSRREHEHPEHRGRGEREDGRELAVRRDHTLQLAPQLVHHVQKL